MRGFVRIVETPGSAASIPFAHQRTVGRIARGYRRTLIVTAWPIEIGLRLGWPIGGHGSEDNKCPQTRQEQAASPHTQCFQPVIAGQYRRSEVPVVQAASSSQGLKIDKWY